MTKFKHVWHLCFRLSWQIELIENKGIFGGQTNNYRNKQTALHLYVFITLLDKRNTMNITLNTFRIY